ncbi:unnamed protein product [Malus baccata var. baccata]
MIRLFKVKEKQRELAENANGASPVKKQSAGELHLHGDISELNLAKTCSISFPNGKDQLMNFEVTIRLDEGYDSEVNTKTFNIVVAQENSCILFQHCERPAAIVCIDYAVKSTRIQAVVLKNKHNDQLTTFSSICSYRGGTFSFTFQVAPIYPHEALSKLRLYIHMRHGKSSLIASMLHCLVHDTNHSQVYHPNIDLEGNVCLNILREDWKPVLNIKTEPNYEDPLNHDAAAVLRDNPMMFESNVRRVMAGGDMIRLFKEKEKLRAQNAIGASPFTKQSAGKLRLNKDMSELNLPKSCSIHYPDGKDELMNFEVTIHPDEGYYKGGVFLFTFQVAPIYPHEAPKVKCKTKVKLPIKISPSFV